MPATPLSEDDPRFLAALHRGDERAFSLLVRAYEDRVFAICLRLLGQREEARDVAQEVFVTVYRKIDRFRGDSKLSTWIYRVATNHAKNRIKYLARRYDRRQESYEAMVVEPVSERGPNRPPRPDEEIDGRRLEAFLQRALALLEPDQREAVILRDLEGLPYDEIAEITGATLGTVKSRIHRGRTRLMASIEAWQAGEDPTLSPTRMPPRAAPKRGRAVARTAEGTAGRALGLAVARGELP